MEMAGKRASFLETVKTVLAGFAGIRRRADHERAQLNPVHLVVIAVLFVVLFVLTLRTLVGMIVS
jgi:Protein of unknown function (DUF2970)